MANAVQCYRIIIEPCSSGEQPGPATVHYGDGRYSQIPSGRIVQILKPVNLVADVAEQVIQIILGTLVVYENNQDISTVANAVVALAPA